MKDISQYIFWDSFLKRWDLTTQALNEQTDPEVRAIINAVLRSWFGIPLRIEQQLPLISRKEVDDDMPSLSYGEPGYTQVD